MLLKEPVLYSRSQFEKPVVMAIGQIGTGKSSLLNALLKQSRLETDLDFELSDSENFKAEISAKAVTTKLMLKEIPKLYLIDTIGMKEKDDESLIMTTDFLREHQFHIRGLSTVIAVIAWPRGGRIDFQACKPLFNYLNSLTLTYPNIPIEQNKRKSHPQFLVVFTGISAHKKVRKDILKPMKGENILNNKDLINS